MSQAIVFMFSGQGSQYFQMGKELFEECAEFRISMQKLDRVAQAILNVSLLDQIYAARNRKADPFLRTLYTHPAIFMVEYSMAQVLLREGISPDFVLGTSLGEFVAAAVGRVMDVETALAAVIQQAQAVEARCPPGGMAAILASPAVYQTERSLFSNSELAAVNSNSHFVISGGKETLQKAVSFLKTKQINYQILPVSHGFHSSFMDDAAPECLSFLETITLQAISVPFVSCVYGRRVNELSASYFWNVSRLPIQFAQALQDVPQDSLCIDLGPSGTLATLIRHHGGGLRARGYPIMTPFSTSVKNLETVLQVGHRSRRKMCLAAASPVVHR